MNGTEQLLAAVDASHADPAKKALVKEFLDTAGPVVEALGPSVFQEIMRSAAAGQVPDAVVESLNAAQVAALLAEAEADLAALADTHRAQVAAWNAALGQLESAALGAVARVLVGFL